MKLTFACLSLITISLVSIDANAQEPRQKAVRMGSGVMTFETVPGWGFASKW